MPYNHFHVKREELQELLNRRLKCSEIASRLDKDPTSLEGGHEKAQRRREKARLRQGVRPALALQGMRGRGAVRRVRRQGVRRVPQGRLHEGVRKLRQDGVPADDALSPQKPRRAQPATHLLVGKSVDPRVTETPLEASLSDERVTIRPIFPPYSASRTRIGTSPGSRHGSVAFDE